MLSRSHQGCFSRLGSKGSTITAFKPFHCSETSVAYDKGSLPPVKQWQG